MISPPRFQGKLRVRSMTGGTAEHVEADIQAKLADEARGEVRLLRSGSMTTPNASVDRLINGAYGSPERLRDAAALLGEDEQEALALLTRERSVTGAGSCSTPRRSIRWAHDDCHGRP